MADDFSITIAENNGKKTTTTIPVAGAAAIGDLQAVTTAVNALVLGTIQKNARSVDVALPAGVDPAVTPPASAQRGAKWLVKGVDANGKAHEFTLGTADDGELTAGSDNLSLADAEAATLKTTVDAVWAPEDVACTVTSIEYVNRNVQ